MRILYIVPFVPWPIRVRTYNLIPRLASRHTIDLVCLASSEGEFLRLNGLGSVCGSVRCATHHRKRAVFQAARALPTKTPLRMAYASSSAMEKLVRGAIDANPPDIIYVERWRALQYVPSDCGVPVLSDPTDSMILYNRRLMSNGSWWERIIGAEEYAKFLRYEPVLARRADLSIFCSTMDRDCVLAAAPDIKCGIVPNGVDCKHFFRKDEKNETEPATIILTGNFDYRPNVHGAVYFLEKVFPSVQRCCPAVRFLAVGNGATRKLRKYRTAMGDIEAIDFVPDLRPFLAKATAAVAPLTVGAGVSNKVLEALAVGTPVVATPLACGDLPIVDGEHLYLADNPETFAQRVLEILTDSALRRRMTEKARTLVDTTYDWEVVIRRLENLMHGLLRKSTGDLEEIAAARPV